MPTSLLTADTLFPQFSNEQTSDEKIDKLTNYLYMLLEQLRYSLANVGRENFNDTEFDGIAELITSPVYIQLENEDATIRNLINLTAEGLSARVSAASGAVSELTQTVNGVKAQVSSADGRLANLIIAANGIEARVQDAEEGIIALTLNAKGLESKVASANSDITTIKQTVNSISFEVVNGEESSVIKLTKDNAEVKSQTISFSGYVRFSDLSGQGSTTINGANITTGTISGITYRARGEGACFVVQDPNLSPYPDIGGIRYHYVDGEEIESVDYGDKMYLYTNAIIDASSGVLRVKRPSIKLESAGNISIEAPYGAIYMLGPQYVSIRTGVLNIYNTYQDENDVPQTTHWQFVNGALYKDGIQVL